MSFVWVLKVCDVTQIDSSVGEIASRFESVPFVILPLPGTDEFAIYADKGDWFLGSTIDISIGLAILSVASSD